MVEKGDSNPGSFDCESGILPRSTKYDADAKKMASSDRPLFCRYNDHPHGRFSIDSAHQAVVVMPTDLKRVVQLNITRNAGTVGRVRVSFGLVYNQVGVIVCFIPWGRAVQRVWLHFLLRRRFFGVKQL